jgi:hypothetical protein
LPPSQGGKYVGFGNSQPANPEPEDPLASALSKGWGFLTSVALTGATLVKTGAEVVNQNVIKPAAEAAKEGQLTENIGILASNIAQKVSIKYSS